MVTCYICSATAFADDPVTLRFNQFTPRTHWYHYRILEPWVADIERVTEGRVRVKFSSASLGPFNRNFDLANVGIADVAAGNHSASPGRFALTQIQQSPFLESERAEALSVAIWRVYDKYLRHADEHGDSHVLALHVGGGGHFVSMSQRIEDFGDLARKKVFAGGLQNARVLVNADAIPVHRSMAEAYELISRGVVDAALLPYSGVTGWHLLEFSRQFFTVPGGVLPGSFFVVVNRKSWDRVSPRDKAAIMSVSGEAYAIRAGVVFDDEAEKALAQICESGVEITVASGKFVDDFKEAAAFIDKEWIDRANAAGLDGEAALAYFRSQVGQYLRAKDLPAKLDAKCLEAT